MKASFRQQLRCNFSKICDEVSRWRRFTSARRPEAWRRGGGGRAGRARGCFGGPAEARNFTQCGACQTHPGGQPAFELLDVDAFEPQIVFDALRAHVRIANGDGASVVGDFGDGSIGCRDHMHDRHVSSTTRDRCRRRSPMIPRVRRAVRRFRSGPCARRPQARRCALARRQGRFVPSWPGFHADWRSWSAPWHSTRRFGVPSTGRAIWRERPASSAFIFSLLVC